MPVSRAESDQEVDAVGADEGGETGDDQDAAGGRERGVGRGDAPARQEQPQTEQTGGVTPDPEYEIQPFHGAPMRR